MYETRDPRPEPHETEAETKTNYCETETETKKSGVETTLVSRPWHPWSYRDLIFFTALHGMQTRSSDENSVCPSVKHVHCDKRKKDLSRFLYRTKNHLA